MEIIDKITISATPQKVYETLVFFFRSSENYRLWHRDHVSCYWKQGKDFSPGSVMIAKEYLHGRLHKMGFKIITNEPGKCLYYKMLFPFSMICSGGSFKMISQGDATKSPDCMTAGLHDCKTLFTAGLKFRSGHLLGKLFSKELEATRLHIKEEGIAIKEILEKTQRKTLIL